MTISNDAWFSEIYKTLTTQDISQAQWKSFLSDPDVISVLANQDEEYRKLYLQKVVSAAFSEDDIVKSLTETALPGTTDLQRSSYVEEFLQQSTIINLPATTTKDVFYDLYLKFLFTKVLASSSLGSDLFDLTTPYLGSLSSSDFNQVLGTFLSSDSATKFLETTSVAQLIDLLNSNATDSSALQTLKGLYVSYLTSNVQQEHIVEQVMTISPEDMEQRKILYNVFELLAKMISTTSVAQIRSGQAIQFITEKKSAYAEAYKKAVTYTGGGVLPGTTTSTSDPSSLDGVYTPIVENLTDPSKFDLGYQHITVQDIADWLYQEYQQNPTTTTSFQILSDEAGTPRYQMIMGISPSSTAGSVIVSTMFYNDSTGFPIQGFNQTVPNSDSGTVVQDLGQTFLSAWSYATTNTYFNPSDLSYAGQVEVPKIQIEPGLMAGTLDDTGSSDQRLTAQAVLATDISTRQAKNQYLSSQFSALSSQIDLLDSLTRQQEQVQNVSITGLRMLNSTVRNIVSTLLQILTSLFT